jgi:hypothetical protein
VTSVQTQAGGQHDPSAGIDNRPLTPGEALEKLFMDNADRAANDELVAALCQRARAIQALADRRC